MKVGQTSCTRLEPIDKKGLEELIKNGKANPNAIKTLKCKTVAEGRFRHSNYIRNLPAYIVDEPPTLLGDDTAPNPSEALLAALGSCLAVGIHANAIANNIVITKLELELEGDLNITAVWGTGDLSKDKPLGFTDIRVKINIESNADKETTDNLIAHATKYSPVANTILRAVNLSVKAG
ncbi:peroxiredoxin [Helicobacter sp. 16-1353]|uniref:OsmC family protein n=1 Tax=Helicobacter sp. 16-1353 TaxID=2004996 RepID=UPI000DCB3A98|nr:OsmC family protein [Helicobacter sp. 16-1353]RAX54881.1 peroxiredoxin [Helicobacter sp. 16-1353]